MLKVSRGLKGDFVAKLLMVWVWWSYSFDSV